MEFGEPALGDQGGFLFGESAHRLPSSADRDAIARATDLMIRVRVSWQHGLRRLADPIRFERTASAFGGQRSIQLSYGSRNALIAGNAGGRKPLCSELLQQTINIIQLRPRPLPLRPTAAQFLLDGLGFRPFLLLRHHHILAAFVP